MHGVANRARVYVNMESLLELWFETSEQGVAFLTPVYLELDQIATFHCQRVNKTLAQLLGNSPGELIGKVIDPFVPWIPQAELLSKQLTVLQTGEPWQGRYYYPEKNAGYRSA